MSVRLFANLRRPIHDDGDRRGAGEDSRLPDAYQKALAEGIDDAWRRGRNIRSTTQTRRRPAGSTNEARTFRQEEPGLRQMPARAWPLQRVDRPVAIAASRPNPRQDRRTRPSRDYSRRRQATPGGRGAPCAGVVEQRVGTTPRGTPRVGCQRLARRLPQPECPTPASPRRRTRQSRRLQVRSTPDCSAR